MPLSHLYCIWTCVWPYHLSISVSRDCPSANPSLAFSAVLPFQCDFSLIHWTLNWIHFKQRNKTKINTSWAFYLPPLAICHPIFPIRWVTVFWVCILKFHQPWKLFQSGLTLQYLTHTKIVCKFHDISLLILVYLSGIFIFIGHFFFAENTLLPDFFPYSLS